MPTDLPVPTNGSGPKRERAKEYQLDALAKMSTMGTPPGTMAAVTGLSEAYVDRLLSGKGGETFNRLREKYQQSSLKVTVGAHFDMAELLPESLEGFRTALQAPDLRLRFEAAKDVWNRVVPPLNGKNGDSSSDVLQLVVNQPHVQTQIGETMASVAQSLLSLRDVISSQSPDDHVLVGTDALPVPESQLEVTGGEASLDPDMDPEGSLQVEAVEREDD